MGLRILGLRRETVKRSLACSFHAIRDFARLLIYSKVAGTRTAQMKRARVIFSVLILIVPTAFLALQAKPSPASVEDEIKDFEQRANAAYEANDLAKYFSFYAADFSQFLPEGRTDLTQYRKDWTAYIGEGNRVQKVEISDMRILVGPNKDTAVASYILHVRTKLKDGKVTDEDNQESDVMFKRNGEWKVVFLHYSTAPKK
jgi:ketosteroid isomerase-like protein